MPQVEQEGVFHAEAIKTSIFQSKKTQSIAVNIRFRLIEIKSDDSGWSDWTHDVNGESISMEADFAAWIVKKDGQPNEEAITNLAEIFRWDGDVAAFANGSQVGVRCQVTVKEDDYSKKYRVAWVNAYDYVGAPVDPAKINAANGAKLRAVAGNALRNATTPAAGAPAAAAPSVPTPTPQLTPGVEAQVEDPIPF